MSEKPTIDDVLTRGVAAVYPSKEALKERLESGEKVSLYFGIDPTGPDLHLGHATSLLKLKDLQDLGHNAVVLIGGFTARIGDPTDKSAARTALTKEEVKANARNYKKQISLLGLRPTMADNSKWFDRMSVGEWMGVSSHFTAQQLLERDMFETRMKEGKPIYAHELNYPIMQAFDSVALDTDGEIGGNDQTFNMLAGRDLMKSMAQKDKFVIAMTLLEDPTGKKMGKTEGNMAKLSDAADEMFGKIMSWTDGMIIPGLEILTRVPMEQVEEMAEAMKSGENPKRFKERLAKEVVTLLHGTSAAENAAASFTKVFSEHALPSEMPTFSLKGQTSVVDVLVQSGLATSKSDARRVIEGGGVKLDHAVIEDVDATIIPGEKERVLQKGKRHFLRIV